MGKDLIRIKNVAKYIKPYKKIADVGCDHGYLIIEGFENYNIDYAIAIDNKSKPLERCNYNLKEKPYYSHVRFSLSSGINDIDNDTECIIMAGMGGILIKDLLEENLDKLKNIKRIIIQANKDNYLVRKFLTENGFDVKRECICLEDKKYYQVICFDKSDKEVPNYNDIELEFGPINVKRRSKVFTNYINSLIKKINLIPFENEKIKNRKTVLKELIGNES